MLFSGEVTFWWFGVTNSAAAMQSNASRAQMNHAGPAGQSPSDRY